jgi:prefoldin subunit 5
MLTEAREARLRALDRALEAVAIEVEVQTELYGDVFVRVSTGEMQLSEMVDSTTVLRDLQDVAVYIRDFERLRAAIEREIGMLQCTLRAVRTVMERNTLRYREAVDGLGRAAEGPGEDDSAESLRVRVEGLQAVIARLEACLDDLRQRSAAILRVVAKARALRSLIDSCDQA